MPDRALSRSQVRRVDRRAVEEFHMPGVILMENAGRGTAEVLAQLGIQGPVVICAGKGNNGGDGFVVARHLHSRGYNVSVLVFCDPGELKGDALINYRIIQAARLPIVALGVQPDEQRLAQQLQKADWIVDALLGTGTQGEVREPYATVIDHINTADGKVLAIDLPSGMDCDTGEPLGCCIRADHTATFVARKIGFDSPGAADNTGTVHVIDIGVPRAAWQK